MDKSELQEEKIFNALEGLINQEITIQKQQQKDTDVITMTVDHVQFRSRQGTIDDYVSPLVIQIHGNGQVVRESTKTEDLPQSRYEIPIDQMEQVTINDTHISIKTKDRNYMISKAH